MQSTYIVWRRIVIKQAAISVRVESELKERLEAEAQQQGMTFAAYVANVLAIHSMTPSWTLTEPEVVHTSRSGTRIKLSVATGWPVALLTPAHAEKLAIELSGAAATARKLMK
jgi:hypothetical protein